MDRIADWLKQSKGAPLVASLLILMLITNAIFDFILKAPAIFRTPKTEQIALSGEVQTTLYSLVTTLQSTNNILQEMTATQGKMVTQIQQNNITIANLKLMLDDVHNRQVTRTEFDSEMEALKKKIDGLKK